ncbi:hypothetical protein M446_6981 (plasmid) [Methylobacterium sp. 4-46]|nr:hypothetical protein M446_6981 [Methylobacterium sp. 4-46]
MLANEAAGPGQTYRPGRLVLQTGPERRMQIYRRLRERGFSPVQTLAMIGVSVPLLVAGASITLLGTLDAWGLVEPLRASIPRG